MEQEFLVSKIISKETKQTLLKRKDNPATIRFFLLAILYLAINILVVIAWNQSIEYLLISQIIYAILTCSIFAALHETAHGTAFKTKKLNRISSLISGFFHFYPPSLFKELHFTHHRFTHVPGKDPEISFGNKPLPPILLNIGTYLSWISGLPVLFYKFFMLLVGTIGMPEIIRKNIFPFVNKNKKKDVFIECLIFVVGYFLIIYLLLINNQNIMFLTKHIVLKLIN